MGGETELRAEWLAAGLRKERGAVREGGLELSVLGRRLVGLVGLEEWPRSSPAVGPKL